MLNIPSYPNNHVYVIRPCNDLGHADQPLRDSAQKKRSKEDDSVPVMENDFKSIEARVRTINHVLPFRLYRTLLVWLVLHCISHLNMEPTSTNTDDYSPREVFFQRDINYERDLRI